MLIYAPIRMLTANKVYVINLPSCNRLYLIVHYLISITKAIWDDTSDFFYELGTLQVIQLNIITGYYMCIRLALIELMSTIHHTIYLHNSSIILSHAAVSYTGENGRFADCSNKFIKVYYKHDLLLRVPLCLCRLLVFSGGVREIP